MCFQYSGFSVVAAAWSFRTPASADEDVAAAVWSNPIIWSKL
jgi:hypothetical protein